MTKNILLGLAVFAGTVSYAQQQQAPAAEATYGLLGQRYAQAGFGFIDVNRSETDVLGAGIAVNAPVNSNVDVSLAYAYQWVEARSEIDGHALDLSATYFVTQGQLKPFATVTVGYVWPDLGDELTWGAAAGFEYVVNSQLSVQLAGDYEDNFKSDSDGSWSGVLSANYWVNQQVAVTPAITLIEGGSVGYALAATLRF